MIFESSALDAIIRNDGEQLTALQALPEGADAVDSAAMFREIDREFHERLLQATGNDLVIQMTSIITNYFFEIAPSIDLNREEIGKMLKEHKEIIEKIIDKDAEGAKKILAG